MRCWYGAELRPYQASLVMFTSSSAPGFAKPRTMSGKMAS